MPMNCVDGAWDKWYIVWAIWGFLALIGKVMEWKAGPAENYWKMEEESEKVVR